MSKSATCEGRQMVEGLQKPAHVADFDITLVFGAHQKLTQVVHASDDGIISDINTKFSAGRFEERSILFQPPPRSRAKNRIPLASQERLKSAVPNIAEDD